MTLTPTLRTLGYCVSSALFALGCGGSSSGSTEQTSAGGSGGTAGSQGDGGVAGNGGASGSSGSGGSSGSSGSGGVVDAGSGEAQAIYDALTAMADAYCGHLVQCCEQKNLGFDEANCRSLLLGVRQQVVDTVPEKLALGLTLDAMALARCAQDAADAAHVCEPRLPDSCTHYWKGHLNVGDACEVDDQCAEESSTTAACEQVQGQKVCVVKARAGEGQACEWTCTESNGDSVSCETSASLSTRQGRCFKNDGLHCEKGVCTPDRPLGSSCLEDECKTNLYCDAHVCTPRDALCGGDGVTPACVEGYCDDTGSCIGLGEDGAPCKQDYECLVGSCGYEGCGTGERPFWLNFCQ